MLSSYFKSVEVRCFDDTPKHDNWYFYSSLVFRCGCAQGNTARCMKDVCCICAMCVNTEQSIVIAWMHHARG